MTHTPIISLIMPTRNRAEKVEHAVGALARQQAITPVDFELLIGIDGDDPATEHAIANLKSAHRDLQLHSWVFPQRGIAHIKNELIGRASGDLLLFMNDDVIAAPDFVAQHIAAHGSAPARGRSRASHGTGTMMVLGDSPFLLPDQPERTFFDELIARTSMIFFYDQMPGARLGLTADQMVSCFEESRPIATQSQAHANTLRDWGFRHAWNLNLSVPKALVEEVGGFNCGIANCCYEDVELAYRIATEFDAPVIFNPAAIAVHDHQMSPNDYLAREYRLGYAVFGFARFAPEGAVAVFGHDPASPDALAYAKQYVAVEGRREQTLRTQFASIAAWSADTHLTTGSPPDAISEFVTERDPADGHPDSQLIRLAYEFHLPLKRLMFRRGLLDAAEGRRVAGLYHADDTQRPATTLHQ